MRKKNTEMPEEFGFNLIDESVYGVLSIYSKSSDELYSIPMSFVRMDNSLFFHTGKVGKKVELFTDNMLVNVVFVKDAKVPSLMSREDMAKIKEEEGSINRVKAKVFTNEFSSTVINGRLFLVTDEDLRYRAIYNLCEKYTPHMKEFINDAIDKCMSYTSIYEIKIENIYSRKKSVEL